MGAFRLAFVGAALQLFWSAAPRIEVGHHNLCRAEAMAA